MKLCPIFISILAWGFLSLIEARFLLEIAKPEVHFTELFEEMAKDRVLETGSQEEEEEEGRFSIGLYECEIENYMRVKCIPIDEIYEKYCVYAVANFHSVWDLKLPGMSQVEIDGKYFNNFPQPLTLGRKPPGYYGAQFDNPQWISDETQRMVRKYLGRLVPDENSLEFMELCWYFSLNDVGYFFDRRSQTKKKVFATFTTVMMKIIEASGYDKDIGSPSSSAYPYKLNTKGLSCGTKYWLWSTINSLHRSQQMKKKSKSWSLFGSRQSETGSQPPVQPKPETGSQPPVQPKPEPEPLSKKETLEAAGLLMFKMFDPCYLGERGEYKPILSNLYCAIHCRFLSAVIQLYGQNVSNECDNLHTGACVIFQCQCSMRPARKGILPAKTVMLNCNNALRLHIYKQAAKRLPPASYFATIEKALANFRKLESVFSSTAQFYQNSYSISYLQ